METIPKILLADNSEEFRLLLRRTLEDTGEFQVVGDTGDGTVREDGSYVPGQVDRLRLTYNGNVSSALYVTSAAQLPDYPELSAYDDAFFKDHALVLVQESVSSGSVEVGIESVSLKADHTAVVALTHQGPGEGQVGTADMATWLLWTEVDTGLEDYQWTVANPALESIPNPCLPRRRGFFGALPCRTHWKMRRR